MSNFPSDDGPLGNQPQTGPYSRNYGSTQPGPFNNNRYGASAPAPGQYQQQPIDPSQQEMQEFLNYKFSPEEFRVIKQCEIDALFKRSLPIGFGLGFGTFWAVQKGVLKAGKFGAWPKVIASSIIGYVIGRFSYMKVCQQRIMEIPNSRLAQMLRNRSRKYNPNLTDDSFATDAGFATALTLAPLQTDEFNRPNSSLNMDTNRPYNDIDDHYVPSREGSNDLNEDLNIPIRKNLVSYDELRQKNRDDFMQSRRFGQDSSNFRQTGAPLPAVANNGDQKNVPIAPAQSGNRELSGYDGSFAENDRRRASLRTNPVYRDKNQYGDIWSE